MTRVPAPARALAMAAVLTCVSSLSAARNAFSSEAPAPPKFRLPSVAAPQRYRLDLTLIPNQDTFQGSVEIDLNFSQASSILWLNADRLDVKEASLSTGGQSVGSKVIPTPKDYVGISFDHPVGPGPATLRVSYQGKIDRKDMQGIFQVKDGDDWYVYSQFENIGARRAFPCFDEPGYKVPWQLTLHVKKEHVALSNTPIASEVVESNGMRTVRFAETKPLPSYLVALTVGNLDFADAGTAGKKNTRIRIVVPHGRAGEARYAVESTPTIVNLLENYFGIPYPYDKLDEVAIPLAGYAMEHPGLVTYGAAIILTKPDQETLERKRLYASVAAHELAHQWFGDLVTTAWWDDIWLNEGFASWMSNKIVNQFHPEWKMNISELNGYQGAMETDALVSARKVRQPVESNDDIANAFDSITYNKGSALLNMFESYMGRDEFQAGIRRYLAQYSWKNATSAEFLAALGGENSSIARAFSTFLDQAGVPLVTAKLSCGGQPHLELTQQRFLPLGSQGSSDELWDVPVCVRYRAGTDDLRECTLLEKKSADFPLSKAEGCPDAVLANAGADGYYRTAYSADLLSGLLKDDAKALDLPEKVGLIGDIAALTSGGQMRLGAALELMPPFAHDPSRPVVTKTMQIAAGLDDNMVPEPLLPKYRKYIADLYGQRAHQLGWKAQPGEDDDTRLLRPSMVSLVANVAEDPELIEQARKLASAWLADRKAVDPDMVGVVLNTAAHHGDRMLFDAYRAAARKEPDERTREQLLDAMGSFRDPEIAKIALPIVLTDEFDSRESLDIPFVLSGNRKTRDLAYDFVKNNFDALVAKLPTDSGAFIPFAAAGYCDSAHRADAEQFFKDRSTKYSGGPRNLAQVLEGIDLCVAYKSAQQPSLVEFLEKY